MSEVIGRQRIGASLPRKEDLRFVKGSGQFTDDLNKPDQLYGYFVRSTVAHANIRQIITVEASKSPKVVEILTGADYTADGFGPIIHRAIEGDPVDYKKPAFDRNDPVALQLNQWPLALDKVRHVGEPVALVIAETVEAAADAAELVVQDLEVLKPVVDVFQASDRDALEINEGAPGNIVVKHLGGNKKRTEEALKKADVVVRGKFNVPRVVSCQMEPRSGIGEYDYESNVFTITAGNQGVHRYQTMIASALKVDPGKIRVICPDTGGGFGSRGHVGPEFVILAWAAQRLGRAVKWTSSRTEAFVSDWQGRDMFMKGELGVTRDGSITAYKVEFLINNGAHTICYAPSANASRSITTTYDIPVFSLDMGVYLTTTTPVLPYRAAGRPETHYVLERLIDMAASKIKIDKISIRVNNLIRSDQMPFKTPMGLTYDVGDFDLAIKQLAELIDWSNFAERKEKSVKLGKLRGISLVPFIETPVGAPFEMGRLEIDENGIATIYAGTQNHGQGHETTYAQVVSDLLGIPFENINLTWGDTNDLPRGGGTHSDRSMRMMGTVLYEISKLIIKKSMPVAAHLLQVDEDELVFDDGKFILGDNRQTVDILTVAAAFREFTGGAGRLAAVWEQKGRIPAFPYGASGVEVEIDPETGVLTICRYALVDDCGLAINPMIVEGQVHGGIVQGAGQAIGECAVFDSSTGQLLTGSFMDYAIPRADQFPNFSVGSLNVKTKGNPLGVKAGGEAGTVPALALIGNAVMDALSPFKIRHFDMPFSASKIWSMIQDAKKELAD